MTLKELQNLVNSLCEAGHGDCVVVKSSDDEGNSFSELHGIEAGIAVIDGYYIDLKHPDDLEEYDDEDLSKVICVW